MSIEPTRRKLLFHIGHHKTGSTSIQYALATGKVKLDGGTILYPGKLTHNYLRRHFDTYVREGIVLDDSPGFPNLDRISKLLQSSAFDVAVISGEAFEWADPVFVNKVLHDFMLPHVDDYSILCYVRPHAERIVSGFSESIKIGNFKGNLEIFARRAIKDGRLAFSQKLAGWSGVFDSKMIIRPMVRSELVGGSVVRDFLVAGLGHDTPVQIESESLANKSLCLEELLLIKMAQERLKGKDEQLRLAVGWELSETISKIRGTTKSRTKLTLHKALAEEIRISYLEDAREMDIRYFQGRNIFCTALDHAVDTASPEPQSLNPSDYFDEETLYLVRVLTEEISALLGNTGQPWQKYLLKRRIARLHNQSSGIEQDG